MRADTLKPLTLVAGTPLIDRVVDPVRNAFPEAWSIVAPYKPSAILSHLALLDKKISCVQQRTAKGTGHALKSGLKSLSKATPGHIVVVPGDHPMMHAHTLRALYEKGKLSGAPITIATILAPGDFVADNPFWLYQRVVRDQGGSIRRIVALNDTDKEERAGREVNVGCYVFDTGWLLLNINKIHPDSTTKEYHLSDLIRVAAEGGDRIAGYTMSNWREGVGVDTPEDLRFVEDVILGKSMLAH